MTSVRLGPHDLPTTPEGFVTALAPMAAITNPAYRTLAREQGCGLTVTEMVSSEYLVEAGAMAAEATLRMERSPEEKLLVVQLYGGDAATMAEAARIAVANGANAIDINMGCPVRRITGRCAAGVALMREPSRAAEIVRSIVAAVPVPVSAKLRAGWDDSSVNAPELARALEGAGVSMLAVHARTRAMAHSGSARLEVLRAVKSSVQVPVLGNGGVLTPEDARSMVAQTGCDGVMIGRAAHGNPWLFRSLATGETYRPSLQERFDAMRRHTELYAEHTGDDRAAREIRKHLLWYLTPQSGDPLAEECGQLRDALRHKLPQWSTLAAVMDGLNALAQRATEVESNSSLF